MSTVNSQCYYCTSLYVTYFPAVSLALMIRTTWIRGSKGREKINFYKHRGISNPPGLSSTQNSEQPGHSVESGATATPSTCISEATPSSPPVSSQHVAGRARAP